VTLTIDDKTKVKYSRSKGHVYIDIPIVREGGTDLFTILGHNPFVGCVLKCDRLNFDDFGQSV